MKKLLLILIFLLIPRIVFAALNFTNSSTIEYGKNATNWNLSVVTLKDIVATSPITINGTAAVNNILVGVDGDVTLAIVNADDDDSTKGASTFNNTDFDVVAGLVTIVDDGHAHTTTSLSGIDISSDTNLTAGDALTLNDDDLDFDGGATPGGELGGTWASPTLDDNASIQYIFLENNSAATVTNSRVNFIPGSGITLAVTNATYGTNVTITSSAGGGNVSQTGAVTADNFTSWSADATVKDSGKAATSFEDADANIIKTTEIDTSAEIAAIVGGETGTGNLTFNTSPTITTATLIGTTQATGFLNASNINATNINGTTVLGSYVNASTAVISLGFINGSTLVSSNAINLPEGGLEDSRVVSADIKDATIAAADLAAALKVKTISKTIYNITTSFDGVIDVVDAIGNVSRIYALCEGGTNVSFMIEKCNVTGATCEPCNATHWTAENLTVLNITAFSNATLAVNQTIRLNTSAVNGNPPWFTVKVYRQE